MCLECLEIVLLLQNKCAEECINLRLGEQTSLTGVLSRHWVQHPYICLECLEEQMSISGHSTTCPAPPALHEPVGGLIRAHLHFSESA